jgi:hypothetical protein
MGRFQPSVSLILYGAAATIPRQYFVQRPKVHVRTLIVSHLEARRELQQARDRVRHLEAALRTARRVLAPYVGGNGR